MSLGKLLTAGKSLVGLKNEASKYQMSDPRVMPKFGSAKNPFRASTRPGVNVPARPESRSAQTAVSAGSNKGHREGSAFLAQVVGRKKPGAAAAEQKKRPEPKPVKEVPSTEAPKPARAGQDAEADKGPALSKATLSRLKKFSAASWKNLRETANGGLRSVKGIQGKLKMGKAAPSARERQPVQGELSLDKVTVMRNDLSDADLEVVRTRPVAAASGNAIRPGQMAVSEVCPG